MAGLPASIPANEAEAHHPALLPMVVSTLHCFLWLSEHPALLPTPVSMAAVEPAAAERAEGRADTVMMGVENVASHT